MIAFLVAVLGVISVCSVVEASLLGEAFRALQQERDAERRVFVDALNMFRRTFQAKSQSPTAAPKKDDADSDPVDFSRDQKLRALQESADRYQKTIEDRLIDRESTKVIDIG